MRRRILGLLVLAAFFALPLHGQEEDSASQTTTAEQQKKIQDNTQADATYPQESWLRKEWNDFGNGANGDGRPITFHGFLPIAGTIWTGSGASLGLGYTSPVLQGAAAYSWDGYQLYDVRLGYKLPHMSYFLSAWSWSDAYKLASGEQRIASHPFLFADVSRIDRTREYFYGIGPDSLTADRTDFSVIENDFAGVIGYEFGRHMLLEAKGGLLQISLGGGNDHRFPATQSLFDSTSVPGLTPSSQDFVRASSALLIDFRDQPGNPHHGTALAVQVSRLEARDSSPFDFNRLTADLRQFVPLGSPSRVVALRFYTSMSRPDSGNVVPFYMMNPLGGNGMLQGYRDFRFRDNDLLDLAGEYRWEARPWLEFAAICNAGKVFPGTSDFNLQRLKIGYGGGVRIKAPATVIMRVDYGHSAEGNFVYFGLGPTF